MRLDVSITRSTARTIVSVAGELDYVSTPDLLRELHPLFEVDAPPVVAMLDGIEFVDTCGLGALLWAHRRAESVGTTFQIAAPSPVLSRRLTLMGLDRHLLVVAGRADTDDRDRPDD